MAEAKTTKTGIVLSTVDEQYEAPKENPTPGEVTKGIYAKAIREGVSREKRRADGRATLVATQHAGQLNGLKQAHEKELERNGALHGRAKFWQGALVVGTIVGSIVAVAAAWYTDSVIQSAFDAASTMRARADITESVMRERDRTQP